MSNERIDVTEQMEWLHEPRGDRNVGTISKHDVVVETGYIEGLIAELKKCYEREDVATEALLENAEMMRKYVRQIIDLKAVIDIYQSTGEDFDTQIAFHEKGLCEYLKHPCGPCEGEEE